ncbi:alkaline phosphatase D family protein [Blastococcus sp. VKM Ac-2987]|uniref:alkaline phosphatase D family protein n=1 Tax=Blastococcus sp. VKM Ac-2987 TaxID=3004141 RepID=UPI0022ABACE1|nr:alkaline phosphatase D family protein [Blastococcus sp. VKM Ac-2987]MCZ2860611.1 alkaline phosphatase D family protein [Blastococcus sp. VKM Ac-2987]
MRRRVREDWWAQADIDRAQIFVPAIMGAGILVSAFTLVRDALHGRDRAGRSRRTALHALATARSVRSGEPPDTALTAGVRLRVHYLLLALAAGGLAGYGARGATKNYTQAEGLFGAGVSWMYALLLLAAAALAAVAAVALVVFLRWPEVPGPVRPLLAGTPLGRRPPPPGAPSGLGVLLLGWAAVLTGAAAAQFVFTVAGAPQLLEGVDEAVPELPGWTGLPLELVGAIPVAVALAVLVGLLTRRCPPFALGQLTVVGAALVVHLWFTDAVERAHPPDGPLAGMLDSLPSGPALQATLLAGFVPLAVYVRSRRRRPALAVLAGTVVLLAGYAVLLVRDRLYWPSDVGAGVLVGTALVLTTWWALERRRFHRDCSGCPWQPAGATPSPGLLTLGPTRERAVRRLARGWLAAALLLFVVLALVEGLPTSPEGDTMGPTTSRAVQLGLLGLAAVGLLVALRFEAVGALLAALAGTSLGIFAALTYQPWVSVLIGAAFLVPAVGFWLVWQHRSSMRAVTTLALVTALVLGGTYGASAAVFDRLFGPAHPVSPALAVEVDQVLWAWSGGVTGRSARVVAGLDGPASAARLVVAPAAGGEPVRSEPAVPTERDVVRLPVDGLVPGTEYHWVVEVDGRPDEGRGRGSFRTAPEGPASFTLAVSGCARTGSSGAVFDAIRDVDPLLYLQTGDLHYADVTRNDVGAFGDRYETVLTAPAQAALYREVPVAYVWGDHDFGGDGSDGSSPVAPAARQAYREYVPHHALPADGAVHQAFTVGRVRIVLTDTRSARTATSMLGAEQKAWLADELVRAARTHAAVLWVNPDPWVAPDQPGRDDWGGYAEERRELADVIAGAGIDNLVMLSGDAHMVAVDDGSHTDYSTAGGAGFPLLHAAALDRPGSVKGGPYSEGAYPGAGQFGTVTVDDDGGSAVTVTLAGWTWTGERLVSHRVTMAAPAT